jgi:hypothetical protein
LREGERERSEKKGRKRERLDAVSSSPTNLTSVLYVWYEKRGRRVTRYSISRAGGPMPRRGFILGKRERGQDGCVVLLLSLSVFFSPSKCEFLWE